MRRNALLRALTAPGLGHREDRIGPTSGASFRPQHRGHLRAVARVVLLDGSASCLHPGNHRTCRFTASEGSPTCGGLPFSIAFCTLLRLLVPPLLEPMHSHALRSPMPEPLVRPRGNAKDQGGTVRS